MAASAGGNRDQPVGAFFNRLMRVAVVDNVVERNPAPGVDRIIEFGAGTKRGDDQRDLIFLAGRDILFEAVVRAVDDLIDCEGGGRCLGVVAVVRGKRFGDFVNPFAKLALRPSVKRREASDDARPCTGRSPGPGWRQ
jgi:hypothetical protein